MQPAFLKTGFYQNRLQILFYFYSDSFLTSPNPISVHMFLKTTGVLTLFYFTLIPTEFMLLIRYKTKKFLTILALMSVFNASMDSMRFCMCSFCRVSSSTSLCLILGCKKWDLLNIHHHASSNVINCQSFHCALLLPLRIRNEGHMKPLPGCYYFQQQTICHIALYNHWARKSMITESNTWFCTI